MKYLKPQDIFRIKESNTKTSLTTDSYGRAFGRYNSYLDTDAFAKQIQDEFIKLNDLYGKIGIKGL